ncbi:AlpA family phage regulatory protein [Vibrio scophthalmi]|uniref:helix-turn-helix transcriptional regulator n=1 Tax=Vibrio scophthalmi TaxID=45658 RepID=UPI003873A832
MRTNITEQLIREQDRFTITGVPRTTCWEMEKRGEFPKRRKLSKNGSSVAWLLSEINAWIQEREIK